MCTVQGAVLITGIVQVVLGYTGVLAFLLRFISPVSIAPTVAMVGLGLYGAMNGNMIGGEWLWRLAAEPRRLWRRYLIGNLRFIALTLRERVRVERRSA